jgi:hypothetical protein
MRLEGLLRPELAGFSGGELDLACAAVRRGGLTPPPLDHLLDSWLRAELTEADLSDELREEVVIRPTACTMALVDELPPCDLCADRGRQAKARLDAPTSRLPGATWGNLCEECFVQHSPGALGNGEGQFLVT